MELRARKPNCIRVIILLLEQKIVGLSSAIDSRTLLVGKRQVLMQLLKTIAKKVKYLNVQLWRYLQEQFLESQLES